MQFVWFTLGAVVGIVIAVFGRKMWLRILPPIPDPGHRLFGVESERAAAVLLDVLKQFGQYPTFAFSSGHAHQIVMADQRTVIAWFDVEVASLPHNAISLATSDPMEAAAQTLAKLEKAGFSTAMHRIPIGDGRPLALIESDALDGNALVFRQPWYKLRRPSPLPFPRLP